MKNTTKKLLTIGLIVGATISLSAFAIKKLTSKFDELDLSFTQEDEDEIYDSLGEKYTTNNKKGVTNE